MIILSSSLALKSLPQSHRNKQHPLVAWGGQDFPHDSSAWEQCLTVWSYSGITRHPLAGWCKAIRSSWRLCSEGGSVVRRDKLKQGAGNSQKVKNPLAYVYARECMHVLYGYAYKHMQADTLSLIHAVVLIIVCRLIRLPLYFLSSFLKRFLLHFRGKL